MKDIDIGRLCTAMQKSRLTLRRPREEKVAMVRQFVGKHYSEEGSDKEVPINLIGAYVSVVGRKLVANKPRVMLSTPNPAAKPIVSAMQTWANHEIERLNLVNTLQRVVVDALFSIGICKVALATPADSASTSWQLRAGEPFAQRVDLDDFVFDIHARDFDEAGFIGHRYRCPLRVIRDSKIYSKARKDLQGSEDKLFNLEGDERVSVIGRGYYSNEEDYEEFIDLWEVYLPRHRVVLTLLDDQLSGASSDSKGKALRVQKWLGPDCGPYHILGLGVVPGNAMPKAPIQDLFDLHLSINGILRKLLRQANRQKENVFVSGGASEDGGRLIDANDGEAIRVDNADSLKQVIWGGPNQGNFQLFGALKDLFSWLSGNLEIMGGLGAQSKTATQDEMLNQNSSATISDMQDRAYNLSSSVLSALCWYWHHDPFKVMKTTHSPAGLPNMSIQRQVKPEQRQKLSWDDLQVQVDPYSMQPQTPQSRLASMNQIVTQIVLPMMQLLQQQGIAFDANAYLTKVGTYLDQPDLADILTITEPPQQEPGSSGPAGPQPAETTRNYVRRSEGGATNAGKDLQTLNAMRQSPSANGAQPQ